MTPLQQLLRYSRRHRRTIIGASACSVMNKVFDILPEVLIGVAIDVVVSREQSFIARLGYTDPMQQIWILGALTLMIWVCESIFEYLFSVQWRGLAQTLQHELRMDSYRQLQNLDMVYFENRSTGSLVSTLNDDINQLERFLDGGANSLIQVFTAVVLIGAIFFALAPQVATFAMLPIPLILAGAFFYQRKAQPLYEEVRAQASILSARLSNNISGIATIKSFTAEATELKHLEADSQEYQRVNGRAIKISSAFVPIIRMAIMAGFIATLLVGGHLTLKGELAVGSFGVLVFLTQRLLWPLTGLAQTVDLYQRAMASAGRVLAVLKTPALIQDGPLNPTTVRGDIRFDNVDFSYPDRAPVLNQVNIEIPPGQTIAFVGSTGSGKSTLVKLLLRFYEPLTGAVLLDGQHLKNYNLTTLRKHIGLVSQDVFLFHGSVRDNIAYGKPGASLAEIEEAARQAEALEFIQELPQGFDTIIGERGQKLSGGQRQRLSIARAILKNPAILILDEATSAVDNETEAAIQRSLEKISVGRTTLVVAHRLSTIVRAHKIYVLEGGRIVEQGRHGDLMDRDGSLYAQLWRVQTGAARSGAAL